MEDEKEIIIQLCGRMANQMFQFAAGKVIEKKTGINVIFDDSEETLRLKPFRMYHQIKNKLIKKTPYKKILRKIIFIRNLRNKLTKEKITLEGIKEEAFNKFQPDFWNLDKSVYIYDSFFQSEKYFVEIRDELLKDFEIIEKIDAKNAKMLDEIKNSNSISMHVRRGDYLKHQGKFGVLDFDYYKKALEIVRSCGVSNPVIYIFSDDIKWVKENFKFDVETKYVDINSGKRGYFDLYLMKNCKHNIIANSSFSWWGAWLNENENKIVVAPSPWFSFSKNDCDIIPDKWHKVNLK